MKTLLLVILFPALGFCQGFLPRWEMTLSTDLNSYSNSTGSHWYTALSFSPGLYVYKGLSVEPELFYGDSKDQPYAINVSGNLCYSYGMGYSAFVPFVLVGYGIGNGVPFSQPLVRTADYKSAISLFNAGCGVKIMTFGGRALLRVEYRYQSFLAHYPRFTDHIYARRLLLGFAVLL